MPTQGVIPFTFRAAGACDALDGSNLPPGAMSSLKNLIPNPKNIGQTVPRPAQTQMTNFAGFTTPGKVSAEIVIGTRAYGMIASAKNAGKDEPFCYDMANGVFIAISGVTAANSPTSPPTTGPWTPPILAMVAGRILITHPGYIGANKFGWIDVRGFSLATLTGSTHTSTLIDTLSGSPLTDGVAVGDTVTGAGIPANTRVVSMTDTSVTLSQAATATAAGVALTFTSGTKAAPLYGAGDTNTVNLIQAPVSVGQFNGRAYFAVANGLQYTDSLKPWQITLAAQALTLGDDQAVTAIGGLPLSSALQGGVVQALICFKGEAPYWQLTGDQATSDLKIDQVQGSVGTQAPLSLAPAPRGMAYIAPDGMRIIDPITAQPSDPIGANGSGICDPFVYAVEPSRIVAAANRNIYRVSVQNGDVGGQPMQEWWYYFKLGMWFGPHDFAADLIVPCYNTTGDFVTAPNGVSGKLFLSTVAPSAISTYTENGAALMFQWTTTLLPDNQQGVANAIIESTLGFQMPATQTLTVEANDEAGNSLGVLTVSGSGTTDGIWDAMVWGVGNWGGHIAPYAQYALDWPEPLVFKQASVSLSGPSIFGLVIGNLIAPYRALGYQGASL